VSGTAASGTAASRPAAAQAGPELRVMAKWEEFTGWFLNHTGRWPKSARFTLTQRLENHALDVAELLVVARYDPRRRPRSLHRANLTLERMRHLLRLAKGANVCPRAGFETAMRGLDECGRMLHGWRASLNPKDRRRSGLGG